MSTPITPQGAAKHHYNQQQSGLFVLFDANDLFKGVGVDGLVKGGHKSDGSPDPSKATDLGLKAPSFGH